jgi:peptidoglycan/LPS O-acetylase OafA/YrhL
VEEFVLGGVPIGGLILGLVQMFKQSGLPSRWAAPVSVLLGIIAYVTFAAVKGATPEQWWLAVVMGITVGLAASGLYSGTRAVRGR